MNKYIITFIILFFSISLFSQEYVVDIGNPFLKEYSRVYFSKNKNISVKFLDDTSIELPFYDDFSNSFVYPDSTKWIDKFAFVNDGFAVNPINIGYVTLDAINQYGDVYSHLPTYSSAIADYLTSKPVNLSYNISDSIYFSFYYQSGGLGNTPEIKDSLVLQFKTFESDWKSIWRAAGGTTMEEFNLVMIPIRDTNYLKDGFQFRFLNYASVSSNYEPSWISNCDHWHLDNIYIDTARNYSDTLTKDAAFVSNFQSMLKDFESIPWNHYKALSSPENIMKDTLNFVYNNTFESDVLNINRMFEVKNLFSDILIASDYDDNENIDPLTIIEYSKPVNFIYSSEDADSAKFTITGILGTDVIEQRNIFRWNDTIRYYQNFYNYYAYDDGTAEKGYGIGGENTAYASLAYRFTPVKPDTLRGVYIYFNHVLNNGNQKYFFLTVWSDNNGIPGDTIIRIEGVRPEFNGELNGFVYYSLGDGIYIDTTFYIGWTKTTDDMLNCGFDMNRVANNNLFLNITGEWQVSTIEGALMVRPVFGYEPSVSYESYTIKQDFTFYPNPANEFIFFNELTNVKNIEIYDLQGKLVIQSAFKNKIDISYLDNGIYFIKLSSEDSNYKVKKLIISK